MRFFLIKRTLQQFYRQRWWVRAVTLLLVLAGAIFVVYLVPRLVNKPSPVNVETVPKFAARFRQEELVIENPELSSRSLLSYLGQPKEVVNLYLTRAHLDAETVRKLERERDDGDPVPTGDWPIAYIPEPGSKSAHPEADNNNPCATFWSAELAPASPMPAKIHFFQSEGPGSDQQRLLGMMVDAELIVKLVTSPPPDNPHAPGCNKLLRIGQWELPNEYGPMGLKLIVPAGSEVTLIVEPLDMKSPPWNKDEPIESFELGDAPLRAQVISINPLRDGKPLPSSSPIYSARSVGAQSPLTINSLSIGSEELKLNVSGTAFIETKGEPPGGLWNFVKDNLIVQVLIGTLGAAFVGWWLRLVYRLFTGN